MKVWKFLGLRQKDQWISPAYLQTDSQGKVVTISDQPLGTVDEEVHGWCLPGWVNAHSHAFQYAMAGLAERFHPSQSDDFWGWREKMYRIALQIDPEQLEVIATLLYSEMLRMGYTSVAEFHYLHHDQDGASYADPAEMSRRLVAAAQASGIELTLVPVYYRQGGFGTPLGDQQRRFDTRSVQDYIALIETLQKETRDLADVEIGVGVHSLRAASAEEITEIFSHFSRATPKHIHIAEQVKEVEECLAFYGRRPVEWLAETQSLDESFFLVHATHVTESESIAIAKSGARVVLCPSTEGNLGDGIFPLQHFQQQGGQWTIGSDSHVGLSPFEEVRWLDYGQRLVSQKRSESFSARQEGSLGENLLSQAVLNGRTSLGKSSHDFFEVGQFFDAVVLDADLALIATSSPSYLIDTAIYASDSRIIKSVIRKGQRIVDTGRRVEAEPSLQRFIQVMKDLGVRSESQ